MAIFAFNNYAQKQVDAEYINFLKIALINSCDSV